MTIDLTDDEAAALVREPDGLIDADRYFTSPRIKTLKAIRAKLRPDPVREPLPPSPKPLRHREQPPSRDAAPAAERRKKSQPGPPMTLGRLRRCRRSFDRMVSELRGDDREHNARGGDMAGTDTRIIIVVLALAAAVSGCQYPGCVEADRRTRQCAGGGHCAELQQAQKRACADVSGQGPQDASD